MDPDTLIRILVADDHPLVLAGIRVSLQSTRTVKIVGEATDSSGIVDGLSQHTCDVLITDFVMPGGRYNDGLSMLTFIQSHYPDLPIIVFTALNGNNLTDNLIELGVKAVVSKADDTRYLTTAVLAVHAGATYYSPTVRRMREAARGGRKHRGLTNSEMEVLRLYISGLSVGEIAERLKRTKQTISAQKSGAIQKLGAVRDAELFQIIYASQGEFPEIY